ncbi:glycosyltransferase [Thalassobacillus sp. B23F22_16]|uniref:glycosyltransferase n=1 Tax=Thalassobacillus sp. B23F22_16 TaxID=3459513 RepID=UPI00373E3938
MKKKIFVFMFSLSGGGAERTVVNIINNLNKNKFEVILVLGSNKNHDYIRLVNNDIRIKYLNCRKLYFCLFQLRREIIKEKPDILFSTLNGNNILLLISKMLSFRNVKTIVREASNRTQSGNVTKINKLLTFVTYNYFANKVVALSKGVKDDLKMNFNIDPRKIEVIYNPVEVKQIETLSKEQVGDIKKSPDEKLIIAVGRLVEPKDFHTLINAFNIVSRTLKSRLIILGKGPFEKQLKDLSESLGIKDRVLFMGFKDNPYNYINYSDLFVLSSKWEGFSHVIVESMSVGTPVVSTNCKSGPAEIICDNKFGRLVPVADSEKLACEIIEVLSDDETRKELSLLGKKRAQDFNAKTIVIMYERLFI